MKKPGCASQIAQEYLQHNKLIATGKPMSRVGHHPEEKAAKLSRFNSSLASSDPLLRTRKRLDRGGFAVCIGQIVLKIRHGGFICPDFATAVAHTTFFKP